ncbi:hypothetical protein BKA80DRAFT_271079 [Phyllosticta citrichinensis]
MTCDWLEASIMPSLSSSHEASNTFDPLDWINADCLDFPTTALDSSSSSVTTPPLLSLSHTTLTPDTRNRSIRPRSKDPLAPQDHPWQPTTAANPFETLPTLSDDYSFAEPSSTIPANAQSASPFDFTPDMAPSPTPSLSGPESPFSHEDHSMEGLTSATTTAPSSPRRSSQISLKRSAPPSPIMDTIPPAPKRQLRNRHHEDLHEDDTRATPRASSSRATPKTRQPHNMVEKKYREGLNNELERLRRAVRTLPQPRTRSLSSDDDDDEDGYGYSSSVPKPSKAAVLAGAVEYIRYLETEHERLRGENEQLRELEGLRRRREEGWVWRNRAADPLGFLS